MRRYIVRRLLLLPLLLLGVSALTFALIHLAPGDPLSTQFGLNPRGMEPETVERLRAQLGLNDPLPVQYFRYLGSLLRGDLGRSLATRTPVSQEILARFPATLELAIATQALVLLVAIPLGVLSAVAVSPWSPAPPVLRRRWARHSAAPYSPATPVLRRRWARHSAASYSPAPPVPRRRWARLVDALCSGGALLGVSMPSFWFGIMLMLLFAQSLGWLPSTGRGDGTLVGALKALVLPAVTLGAGLMGLVARVTRSQLLEVLSQDHVRTAHAKGLAPRWVLVRHGVRNALIPVVTILGMQAASLLGGAVIVETIFAWPGIGRLAVNAIWRRDYPVIMGTVLVFSVLFVLTNLGVDILYTLIDPRIRYD